MLVLSRGRNDKVVFPTLGISVEILRVAGNKVRLGIEAPQEIPVHRHEVSQRIRNEHGSELADDEKPTVIKLPLSRNSTTTSMDHSIRNRLNAAALGLHLLHRKLEIDDLSDVEATIFKIFNELKAIERELQDPGATSHLDQSQADRFQDASTYTGEAAELQHRALVVEDNDHERELLAGYLRVSGFDVDTATDGLQAMVRLTEKSPPDFVLLDMRMPRFDGRKTVDAIRSNPDYSKLKLFAVSGARREDMNVSLGPNGVDRWFTKPIDPQTLLDAMRDELQEDRIFA